MDSSDWSNGIRYHIFDTRPDTEFNYKLFMIIVSEREELAAGSPPSLTY